MQRSTLRIVALAVFALSTTAASSTPPAPASDRYAAAMDRETNGLFSQAVAKRNAAFAIDNYPAFITAFVRIEDGFFDAYSRDANRFPVWYGEQLGAMGLHELATKHARAFLEAELASGDFDRVVHAYYILGKSRLQLRAGETPTALWRTMVATAKADRENRYWISLALAEANLLAPHVYDEHHTKMATRTESVTERFTKNADLLGPRIVRVLGLSERDARVSHLHIGYAEEAAERRVLEHQLAKLGKSGAYQALRDELEQMEQGAFDSKRFLALMQDDLPFLHERFGAPKDASTLVETLRSLCRGLGQNRMPLWAAADEVAKLYEPSITAQTEQTTPAEPAPRADAAAIKKMGAPAALAHLMSTLTDSKDPEGAMHLLDEDIIPEVVAEHPPSDPSALRGAIRDAYHRAGNPPAQYAAFLRAVESLGPEASAQAIAAAEMTRELREAFTASHDAASFAKAFERFRQASKRGKLPRRGADPAFITAFTTAAVRVIEEEDRAASAAEERVRNANAEGASASGTIEASAAAIAEANLEIREANEQVRLLDEQQRAAMAARNAAVEQLNEAVERANAASSGPDAEAARAEARELGDELNAEIEKQTAVFNEAAAALEAAQQRAAAALERAREQEALARTGDHQTRSSFEAEQQAATEAHKSRDRVKAALGRLLAGLTFVGVEIAPGDPPESKPSVEELKALLGKTDEATLRELAARAFALSRAQVN